MSVNDAFEGRPILDILDTIFITSTVYPKTPQARDDLLARLSAEDSAYELNDEKTYASLKDIRYAQCLHCEGIISCTGVGVHNHPCESCGKPTTIEHFPGARVEFLPRDDDGHTVITPVLNFKILAYREAEEEFVLDAASLKLKSYCGEHPEAMLKLVKKYGREEQVETESGAVTALVLKQANLNIYEWPDQKRSYRIVKKFRDKLYNDFFDPLPTPESFSIDISYKDGKKLSLNDPRAHEKIIHAAGQVSRADYYHQDSSPAFSDTVYKRMTLFVQNFVDVPFEKWTQFLRHAPVDGPGFIYALAEWCATNSDGHTLHVVQDDPNVGNLISVAAKFAAGAHVSWKEMDAAKRAAKTPEGKDMLEIIKQHEGNNNPGLRLDL